MRFNDLTTIEELDLKYFTMPSRLIDLSQMKSYLRTKTFVSAQFVVDVVVKEHLNEAMRQRDLIKILTLLGEML